MVVVDMPAKTKIQELAAEIGMSYGTFIGRCLDRGLSFDTADDVWNNKRGGRGFNQLTKNTVARILRRPAFEVFPQE